MCARAHLSHSHTRTQITHVRAERDLLADNNSVYNYNPWVVNLYFSFQDQDFLYLIMEYIPGGDMMTMLIKYDTFPEDWTRFYIAETILAINSIHALHYIHRYVFAPSLARSFACDADASIIAHSDIKPDNLLVDKEGHIKLSDFGLCTGLQTNRLTALYKKLHNQSRELQQSDREYKSRQERLESWKKKRKVLAYSTVGTVCYYRTSMRPYVRVSLSLTRSTVAPTARLHCSRGVYATGIQSRVRLVVGRSHHVRDARRLPAVLLGDSAGDLPKDHELQGDAALP